jgi:hypothetical protein
MTPIERQARRSRPPTSTVDSAGRFVPWLAASGPLAYRPEEPPEREYYYQYGRVLPGILSEHASPRRQYLIRS